VGKEEEMLGENNNGGEKAIAQAFRQYLYGVKDPYGVEDYRDPDKVLKDQDSFRQAILSNVEISKGDLVQFLINNAHIWDLDRKTAEAANRQWNRMAD